MAEAIGYTGIEVLSNDKSALSLQRVPSLMAYIGEPVAAVDRCLAATTEIHRWAELAASAYGRLPSFAEWVFE